MATLHRQSSFLSVLLLAAVIGWTTTNAFVVPVAQHDSAGRHRPAFLLSHRSNNPLQQRQLPLGRSQPTTSLLGCSSNNDHDHHSCNDKNTSQKQRVLQRLFHTAAAAGYPEARTAGLFGPIKKAHNPITYLILSALAGFKFNWCFRSPYYWFAVGFCIKWYRARYVFKIPVWDRQPNWNNIITSKEQEKDLKAFTCKKCGSTLFIAKTREFFFEGDTGIGGLGCFSCGAKGKDNFIMDRDRIVEDVADVDDYFEYERPLDFVSRAERRKILKEAAGDEDKANQLLVDRANASAAGTATTTTGGTESDIVDAEIVSDEVEKAGESLGNAEPPAEVQDQEPPASSPAAAEAAAPSVEQPKKKKKAPKKKFQAPPPPSSDEDLDILDMDI